MRSSKQQALSERFLRDSGCYHAREALYAFAAVACNGMRFQEHATPHLPVPVDPSDPDPATGGSFNFHGEIVIRSPVAG